MMKVGGILVGLEPYPAKCYGPNLCVEKHKLFKKKVLTANFHFAMHCWVVSKFFPKEKSSS
jgi:hypothetical protein